MKPTLIRVITWLPVGGIERRLCAVVPRLRDLGWNAHVICIREEGPLGAQLRAAGIPLTVIPFKSRLSPVGIKALASYFASVKADVVHSHMYRSNIPGTLAARLAGTRAVFGHVHNVDSWDGPRQILMDRLASRFRTATIAVSAAVQRDVMEKLRLPAAKVPVLYNGIDLGEYNPNEALRRETRGTLGISVDTPMFLIPARLHPQKQPLEVLENFVTAFGIQPGISKPGAPILCLAGEGKLEDELRAAARPYSSQVQVLGRRSDMNALYNASDAVVLSSTREGFSNAVVEALACGKPVIAADVGGNREAIVDDRCGWIHPAKDWAALRTQLNEAYTRGVDGLASMAGDCTARASRFSLDQCVAETHRLYAATLPPDLGKAFA